MKLNENAKIFVPDGRNVEDCIGSTTILAVSAHQDDIEIMSYSGIAECYGKKDKWFCGVAVTDGAGSPRAGLYANHTNEEMMQIREEEQNAAALVGGYLAQFQLKYPSSAVKDGPGVVDDLAEIILAAKPDVIMTHNLADMHDTHVSVALRVISALRKIRSEFSPAKLYGMEVWRSLDWCADRQMFDTSIHPNLAAVTLGVYDLQICGGKRYDLATMGRRAANATFYESHGVDQTESCAFGIDMTSLIAGADITDFILQKIDAFKSDVAGRLEKFGGKYEL
ncbi:MAG: PIG-L family deacetylase [Eubacteriales bacterium]